MCHITPIMGVSFVKGAELWFGDDGLLKVQPDPLLPLVMRPLLLGYEENCQVSYKQVTITRLTGISNMYNCRYLPPALLYTAPHKTVRGVAGGCGLIILYCCR